MTPLLSLLMRSSTTTPGILEMIITEMTASTIMSKRDEVVFFLPRFSGVSEEDVKNSSSSLQDVQAVLLSFISEGTILVGHGLENDLSALKVRVLKK